MHVESSGLKAAATWHRIEILQNCRECCGGMGFLSANKIGPMLADMNVDATFEGDNTVMMQQVRLILAVCCSPRISCRCESPPRCTALCALRYRLSWLDIRPFDIVDRLV